ncbi:MAG TPA: hypothetical protein VJQ43_03295 [Thermoplasmata archaeon]|nr:hypothetical protein [Thermoplasmata archaeon]
MPAVIREPEEIPTLASEAVEAEARTDQESRLVLAELDWLTQALGVDHSRIAGGPQPESPPTVPEAATEAVEPVAEPEPDLSEGRGAPSPYLAERLASAQDVASELSGEFERMEHRSTELRQAVQTLEAELHRASEEVAFLQADVEDRAPTPLPLRRNPEPERVPPPGGDPGGDPESPDAPDPLAFDDFTVDRYNGTVGDLVTRRRKLAVTTIGLAVLISIALLTVTLLWREPIPSPWILAVLPAVWLIPVPFFIASFRGTHRVLARHPLGLPEAP